VIDDEVEMMAALACHSEAEPEHCRHEEQQGDGDAEDLRADRCPHAAP
jgi:hypothetical protein